MTIFSPELRIDRSALKRRYRKTRYFKTQHGQFDGEPFENDAIKLAVGGKVGAQSRPLSLCRRRRAEPATVEFPKLRLDDGTLAPLDTSKNNRLIDFGCKPKFVRVTPAHQAPKVPER